MKNSLLPLLFVFVGLTWFGCGEDPDLVVCEGGACERQEQCEIECEDVCGDPDFLSYQCVDGSCECQCFFGCR